MNSIDQKAFEDHAEVDYITDLKAVRIKWFKMHTSLEKFTEITDYALELTMKYKSPFWVTDRSVGVGVYSPEVLKYIDEEVVDMNKKYGIEHILLITPEKSGLSSLTSNKNSKQFKSVESLNV